MPEVCEDVQLSSDESEVPREERIELAINAWLDSKGSIRKIAKQYNIPRNTLSDRIKGKASREQQHQEMQRLSTSEEEALIGWITQLQQWGWPPRISQIRSMAMELLVKKGDMKPIGINWINKFMNRHHEMKTIYIPPLDKARADAEDPQVFASWFELYMKFKTKFHVDDSDVWNMDEKGFMQGVISKMRVMINKHEIKHHMTQPGNREWVSIIECISTSGQILKPWIIFKAKQHQKAWLDVFKEGHICISENGYTDNELGLTWFEKAFHPESKAYMKGEYRILICDGHASHITTAAIQFCVEHKIILLCLPPHTTHILQPLDVGIFSPLAHAYKKQVHENSRFGAKSFIDKVDFLQYFQTARSQAITPTNIEKAWTKTALLPFNPPIILQRFAKYAEPAEEHFILNIRPTTPPEASMTYSGPHGTWQLAITPNKTSEIISMLSKVKRMNKTEAIQQPIMEQQIEKLGKAAIKAMASNTMSSNIASELSEAMKNKKKKANRTKGHLGYARVMGEEVLEERKQQERDKEAKALEDMWQQEAKEFRRMNPWILLNQRMTKPPATPKAKNPMTPKAKTPRPIGARSKEPVTPTPKRRPGPIIQKKKLIVKFAIRVTNTQLDRNRKEQDEQAKTSQSGRVQRTRKAPKRMY